MEKLISDFEGAVSQFFPEQCRKDFYLISGKTIDAIIAHVASTSPFFGLFVAVDAQKIESKKIIELAEALVPKGLAYLCAWGPDCERVHDCFDEILSDANPESTDENVVMTTWHEDDSFEEALWYFVNSAGPAKDYAGTCKDWIVAVVGDEEWERSARYAMAKMVQ